VIGLLAGPHYLSTRVVELAIVIALLRPPFQYVLHHGTNHVGVAIGPLLLEAMLFMPSLYITVALMYTTLIQLWQRLVGTWSSPVKVLVPPVLFVAVLMLQAWASTIILGLCATGYGLLSRRAVQLVMCDIPLLASVPRDSRWRWLAILTMIWALTHNTKQAGTEWKILARGESVTGYISVLENTEPQYRLLRCDHSLLGGEWLLTEQRRRDEAWQVAEPVFGVFAMLEAVRLVRGPYAQSAVQKKDAETNALVM